MVVMAVATFYCLAMNYNANGSAGPFFFPLPLIFGMKTVVIEQCIYLSKRQDTQFIVIFVFKIGNKRCSYILNTHDFEMTEPLTSSCKREREDTAIDIARYILAKKRKQGYRKFIVNLKHYHSCYPRPSCYLSNYMHESLITLVALENRVSNIFQLLNDKTPKLCLP